MFDKLAQHKVLKPVDLSVEEDWKEGVGQHQQNKRLSSLFRTVKEDGSYEYSDVDRVVVKYDDMKSTFHNNRADKIVAEKYPITSPYMPKDKPIVVRAERIVLDPKTERETIKYYAIDKGDGIDDICRCYHELPDGDVIEISEAAYESLKEVYGNDQ